MLAIAEPISIASVLPELLLVIGGCVALIVGLGRRVGLRESTQWICLVAIVAALAWARFGPAAGVADLDVVRGGLAFGGLAQFVRLSTLVLGLVILLVAWSEPTESERGEFFAMLLFSLTGLMLVGPAVNLVILFMAIELVSIPAYVMVTLSRRDARAVESGTKYFYLGAMSAAMTAFGFSYLYGVAGSATINSESIYRISSALQNPGSTEHALATVGVLLSIAGLLFKISAVPRHWYVADVYQGAASAVSGMLGFVPKFAGIVAILKIVSLTGWHTTSGGLFWMLWIVAALSMTVGNVLALRQTNIKRMLAFSGVAHAGYMLVGVLAGPGSDSIIGDGTAGVLYYAVIYGIANLGAFAVLGILRVRGQAAETLQDVAGLLRRSPTLALLMALVMLALMGLPPTTGFWGKMSLFGSGLAMSNDAPDALRGWVIGLVILAGLNSAIGAAYYLRVTAAVLLYENDQAAEPAPREAQYMGAMMCGVLTLIFTVYPTILLDAGFTATSDFRDQAMTFADKPVAVQVAAAADEPVPAPPPVLPAP